MGKRRRALKAKKATATPAPRAGQTVLLYRAVCKAEFSRTIRTQTFSIGPNSLESKWFAEKPQDAAEWGRRFAVQSGVAQDWILEVELDERVAARLMRAAHLDGIGAARCAILVQLRGAIIREHKA